MSGGLDDDMVQRELLRLTTDCVRLRIAVTPDRFVSTSGAAKLIGNVKAKTLRKWRNETPPRGPPCRRNAGPSGHVYYRLLDLARWICANRYWSENK